MVYQATIERVPTRGGHVGKQRATIVQIGRSIHRASVYPPIRNLAAKWASRANPKDFLGQAREIYKGFLGNWRYVRDPLTKELITSSPEAVYKLVLAGDGIGVGEGIGAGDCDCATVAIGALLEATGFPVRVATTASIHQGAGPLFGHVFAQAHVPGLGWVTVDPVLHPKKQFGAITNHSRIAFWDLNGRLIRAEGNVTGLKGDDMIPSMNEWQDYGFGGLGYVEDEGEPDDWSTVGPDGFGCMVGSLGMIDGSALAGIGVEVDPDENGLVRTPMLEVAPDDYLYMSFVGTPYPGMYAMGDDGEYYEYDGTLGRGFFRKLFRKARKAVRKVGRRIKRGIKKVLKKSKFGRFLLKVGGKIKKIAMKIVKPLAKFLGKFASKLAPIAALIPGYGTAIAAGLTAVGKVGKLMSKFGVKTKGKKGTVRGLKMKNPKMLKPFREALKKEANRMKAFRRKNPRKFKQMLADQKRRLKVA